MLRYSTCAVLVTICLFSVGTSSHAGDHRQYDQASRDMSAAAAYPEKAIRVIVPFAAGGAVDTAIRIITKHMAGTLGQPLAVKNVASTDVANNWQSKSDGYSIKIDLLGICSADQLVTVAPQVRVGSTEELSIAAIEDDCALPEFEAAAWVALMVPPGVPQAILDRLNDALSRALTDNATRKRLLDLGHVIQSLTARPHRAQNIKT